MGELQGGVTVAEESQMEADSLWRRRRLRLLTEELAGGEEGGLKV